MFANGKRASDASADHAMDTRLANKLLFYRHASGTTLMGFCEVTPLKSKCSSAPYLADK